MYTVTKLYSVGRNTVTVYAPTDLSPAGLQEQADVNTRLYISAVDDLGENIGLNYSDMITDWGIASASNWAVVNEMLNDALIDGYRARIPGYNPGDDKPRTSLVLWDATNTLKTFNVNYGDHLSGLSGLAPYRFKLLDLEISLQENPAYNVQLDYCLPVVNGFVCRPLYQDSLKKLYARGGAQLCWQGGRHHTPEAQLLDFSHLGELKTLDIRMEGMGEDFFTLRYASGSNRFTLDADWILTNQKYSLYEYTPIVVLAGSIFFPDELRITDPHTFRFSLQKHAFDISLAYRRYLTDQPNSDAHIAYDGDEVASYLQSQMSAGVSSPDTFVLLVRCPRLWVSRIPLDVWLNGITMTTYVNASILHHRRSNTVRVYHLDSYSDKQEMTIQNMETLYSSDCPCYDSQEVFVSPECRHHSFDNLHLGDCEVIHLLR